MSAWSAIKNPPKVGDVIVTTKEVGAYENARGLLPDHPHDLLSKGTRLRVTDEDVVMIVAVTLDGKYTATLMDGEFRTIPPLEQLAEAADR